MAEIPKCPDCGSSNVFYDYRVKEYRCLSCGRKWLKEKPVEEEVVPEEEEKTYLIRDETMMEVEAEEGVSLERPVETPVEEAEAGEASEESSEGSANRAFMRRQVHPRHVWDCSRASLNLRAFINNVYLTILL